MKKKYKKREIERGWACRSERGEGRERRREEEKKKKEEEEEVKKKKSKISSCCSQPAIFMLGLQQTLVPTSLFFYFYRSTIFSLALFSVTSQHLTRH
jgi:hypothetical protein